MIHIVYFILLSFFFTIYQISQNMLIMLDILLNRTIFLYMQYELVFSEYFLN